MVSGKKKKKKKMFENNATKVEFGAGNSPIPIC